MASISRELRYPAGVPRWLMVVACCGLGSTAFAQPPAHSPEAAEPAAADQAPTPPRIVSLPEVELPPDADVPEGEAVGLELRIDAAGHGEVTACNASEMICDRVRAAIAAAQFEPARAGGRAVAALIAMRFAVRRAMPDTEQEPPGAEPQGGTVGAAPPTHLPAEPEYGATARVDRPPPGVLRLELEEMRDMPGAFGDPFRAIEALPGVTPILSGLPYFYVRGSPPSGTLYIYDDINLPALFHLGLGPSVVHPRMVGPLRLYSGVPPARFGRFIGGIIEAEGPEQAEPGLHGEAEVRLLDVNAFVQAPLGRGELAIAGRYGYPGLLLSIFSPEVDLAYWDYQVRFRHPLGRRDRMELVALGSYDSLSAVGDQAGPDGRGSEETSLVIQFHRYEARLIHERGGFELGSALQLGWEESSLDTTVSLYALTFGPRMWARVRGDDVSLRLGADMIGSAGGLDFDPGDGDPPRGPEAAQDPGRNDVYAGVAGRNKAAVYAELSWEPSEHVTLDLGLRADVWAVGSSVEAALDPRLRATYHVSDTVDLQVAGGIARQPAVFFIPLPGLTEVAIDRGLQTAAQAEAGVTLAPVEGLDIEAQVFAHRYWNLLFPDLFFGDEVCLEEGAGCMNVSPDPRVAGASYGAELFVRRDPSERISGFLSYTLAWAELDAVDDLSYTPSYDVRHVLNLAGRWEVTEGFTIGLRMHLRSGKPMGVWYISVEDVTLRRYEQRLPAFFRLDAQLAYAWLTSWGQMRIALEWLNVTFSKEPSGLLCAENLLAAPAEPCPVEYLPAIVAPNLGVRGSF